MQLSPLSNGAISQSSICLILSGVWACRSQHCNRLMPAWLAKMTQLEEARLPGCSFCKFLQCLLQLSQLKELQLINLAASMDVPESITSLAAWPNLTSLDMGGLDQYGVSEESEASPATFQKILGARSRIVVLKGPDSQTLTQRQSQA